MEARYNQQMYPKPGPPTPEERIIERSMSRVGSGPTSAEIITDWEEYSRRYTDLERSSSQGYSVQAETISVAPQRPVSAYIREQPAQAPQAYSYTRPVEQVIERPISQGYTYSRPNESIQQYSPPRTPATPRTPPVGRSSFAQDMPYHAARSLENVSGLEYESSDPTHVLGRSIRQRESDGQFCCVCNGMVYRRDRIALTDRIYHTECAKCAICKIDLGLATYKDYEGKIYCAPHYAQMIVSSKEARRKSTTSRPNTPGLGLSRAGSTPPNDGYDDSNQYASYGYSRPGSRPDSRGSSRQLSHQRSINAWSVYDLDLNPELQQQQQQQMGSNENLNEYGERYGSGMGYGSGYGDMTDTSKCYVCDRFVDPTNHLILGDKACHFECLTCYACGKRISRWNYKEIDGRAFCPRDYANLIENRSPNWASPEEVQITMKAPAPLKVGLQQTQAVTKYDKTICFACSKKVYATEALFVMERVYHRSCFRCHQCNGILGVENYHVLDNIPFCKSHYRQLLYTKVVDPIRAAIWLPESTQGPTSPGSPNFSECRICGETVNPRDGIQVLQNFYHYNCFRCDQCGQVLNPGRFEMAQGKPYCQEDFLRSFGRQRGRSSRQSLMQLNEASRERSAERESQYGDRRQASLPHLA